jgi:hypothetical protein
MSKYRDRVGSAGLFILFILKPIIFIFSYILVDYWALLFFFLFGDLLPNLLVDQIINRSNLLVGLFVNFLSPNPPLIDHIITITKLKYYEVVNVIFETNFKIYYEMGLNSERDLSP